MSIRLAVSWAEFQKTGARLEAHTNWCTEETGGVSGYHYWPCSVRPQRCLAERSRTKMTGWFPGEVFDMHIGHQVILYRSHFQQRGFNTQPADALHAAALEAAAPLVWKDCESTERRLAEIPDVCAKFNNPSEQSILSKSWSPRNEWASQLLVLAWA